MSRNSRRPAAIAVAGVFAVAPLVSACAAGQHPQTAMPTQLAEGVNAVVNGVYIRNVFLLGPAPGQQLTAGASAPLYAWFVNKALTPDRLIAVDTSGVAQSAQIAGGAVDLPPGRLVATAQPPGAPTAPGETPTATASPTAKAPRTPKAGGSNASATPGAPTAPAAAAPPAAPAAPEPSKVVLTGLTKALVPGDNVRLVLHFQRAGAVTLNVPVTPHSGYYATFSAVPAPPNPTMTPLPAESPSAPSAAPTAKPGEKKPKKPAATPSA